MGAPSKSPALGQNDQDNITWPEVGCEWTEGMDKDVMVVIDTARWADPILRKELLDGVGIPADEQNLDFSS